ncbi:MAG: hypothetical protein OJF49_000032 [Ktedonobacterales bacterium]|nr:MAG: hypothetical protein OJF49_000032 [Ktedonobacterales bacterium]
MPTRFTRHRVFQRGHYLQICYVYMVAIAAILAACTSANTTHSSSSVGPAHPSWRLTYVAIGASDSFGIGTQDPDRQSWPTIVADELGPNTHLINLGVPEETVARAVQSELPIALDSDPDMITVWLGVNDFVDGVALDAYAGQLQSLLSALHEGTHARIVVGNLPNLTLLPRFSQSDPTSLRSQVQRWNAVIASVCAATGVTLVDIYSGWEELSTHPEYISSDGFHPSAIGAERLADIFAVALDQSART